MKKYWLLLPLLLLGNGCVWMVSDPAAERAAETSLILHKRLPEKRVTLNAALKMVSPEKRVQVRCIFARMLCVSGKKDDASLYKAEQARIDLNVLLGFLPEDVIVYDPAGALDCPAEIPSVTAFEKTALIMKPDAEPLELLRRVRQLHLDTVYSGNMNCKCAYVQNCVRLADLTGVEFQEISDLSDYAKRFDNAMVRRKKEQEMEK